ncbi:MAG: hypothetical protein JW959_06770 [Pirellulales bacterium]|nr:hypothetical protein [Pirellulales bacterium]
MDCWTPAPMKREQAMRFSPTLESAISENHPVRLCEDILGRCDWSEWEAERRSPKSDY